MVVGNIRVLVALIIGFWGHFGVLVALIIGFWGINGF
jgi:hypothetical protein